jgi:hypothetical protein
MGATRDLPDDYAWRWYAYHLRHAERQEELPGRLADFHWLEAKLRAADVNSLIADFDYLGDLDWLRPVRDALRRSTHALSCGIANNPGRGKSRWAPSEIDTRIHSPDSKQRVATGEGFDQLYQSSLAMRFSSAKMSSPS